MKTFKFFPIICAASMMAAACQSDKTDTPETDGPEISIKLTSEAPVNARPGEEVSYTFSVAYGKGLAEAVASLDKQEIAGSKATFNNSPVEDTYSFSYTPDATQTGKTLDFVVTVTGTDGALKTSDVPLYVLAAEADIKIIVPDDAPESHEIGTDLAFTVRVTSGTDIRSIKTLKNSTELPELTMETFTDRKNVDYAFTYSPTAIDAGAPIIFTFQVMDTNGNIVSQNYTVTFTKPESAEINEFHGIIMGAQLNKEYGPFLDASEGKVYQVKDSHLYCEVIDFAIIYSGSNGIIFCAPSDETSMPAIYNTTNVSKVGGSDEDVVTNWNKRNTSTFKNLTDEVSAEDFATIATAEEIESIYNDSNVAETPKQQKITQGNIIGFKTSDGKYGAIRLISHSPGKNDMNITIDLKIVK